MEDIAGPARLVAGVDRAVGGQSREIVVELGELVGQPIDVAGIEALIRSQMLLETAVARYPEPVVAVQSDPGGTFFVQVRYADADTAQARTLNIQIPR